MSYQIANAEERAAAKASFEIPALKEREALVAGDFAKMVFVSADGTGERMWVKVAAREGVGEVVRYQGTLANNPATIDGLERGVGVAFGPEHVIDIIAADAA